VRFRKLKVMRNPATILTALTRTRNWAKTALDNLLRFWEIPPLFYRGRIGFRRDGTYGGSHASFPIVVNACIYFIPSWGPVALRRHRCVHAPLRLRSARPSIAAGISP